MFTAREMLPGVRHITDCMGVCMTLLEGADRALLVDTGYGVEDVRAFVGTLTDKPLTVLLTHGHHDHAIGAMWFERTLMLPEDLPVFRRYTGTAQRTAVAGQARQKGFAVPDGWTARPIREPEALQGGDIPLGGLTARAIPLPGHTPGSTVVYVPERRLLLTGDDWNPTTWLFFTEAEGAGLYRKNLRTLLALPFERVLCSHRSELYPREVFEAFASGLTDEVLEAAEPVPMSGHEETDTRRAVPAEGQEFVFDYDKWRNGR